MPPDARDDGWIALAAVWLALNLSVLAVIEPFPDGAGMPRPGDRPSPLALARFRDGGTDAPADWQGVRFRLMRPDDHSPGARLPLLLFLHGAGQRGADNVRQLKGLPEQMARAPGRQRFPCYLLAPQCPEGSNWSHHLADLERLIEWLVERHPIDRRRIYLAGFSMGGYGAWGLAARRPDLFAAVVPVCGGGDPASAPRLAGVPIWAVHGAADEVVPVHRSRQMIEAVRQAGGAPRYLELPGVGHDSSTLTCDDPHGVLRWMFDQPTAAQPSD